MISKPLKIGIGGPVGSGKTALVESLCTRLKPSYQLAVITNDIYTREDAEFLTRRGVLSSDRIVGVETGGCPHTAIREDASVNLEASSALMQKFPDYGKVAMAADAEGAQHLTDLEHARFGVHHADIGAHLAMSWYLPEEIWQSIQMHHAHQEIAEQADSRHDKTATLVALGTLADSMYRKHREMAMPDCWEREEALAFALLGVQRQEIEPLQADINRILSGD